MTAREDRPASTSPPEHTTSVLLLVDDDLLSTEQVRLATRGTTHVLVAEDAAAALEVIDRTGCSLGGVLIGAGSWSQHGRQVVRRLLQDEPWDRVPSIVLVDEPTAAFVDHVLDAGANGVVVRPREVPEMRTLLSLLDGLRDWQGTFTEIVRG